jgi:hypothetical protein
MTQPALAEAPFDLTDANVIPFTGPLVDPQAAPTVPDALLPPSDRKKRGRTPGSKNKTPRKKRAKKATAGAPRVPAAGTPDGLLAPSLPSGAAPLRVAAGGDGMAHRFFAWARRETSLLLMAVMALLLVGAIVGVVRVW